MNVFVFSINIFWNVVKKDAIGGKKYQDNISENPT